MQMRILSAPVVALPVLVFALVATTASADWLNWRGPTQSGSAAPNAQPPLTWSEEENVAWKIDLPGEGSSTPLVTDDQIIVLSSEPGEGDQVRFLLGSYSRADGSKNWQSVATEATPHEGMHDTNTMASWSPVSDGKHIFAYYGSWGVYCFDLNGEKVWSKELSPMTMRAGFGEGSSPGLHGDNLILQRDHGGSSEVVVLDKTNGDERWRVERDEPTNWGTLLVTEHGGKALVITTGENFVRCYDLADGAELWRCGGQTMRPVATPVRHGDSVIVASGFRGSYLCSIPLGQTGDLTERVNWFYDGGTPDIPSPLLSDGRLYFFQGKNGILSCVDASDGTQHYFRERLDGVGTIYASPTAAGGHIYITARDGSTTVIKDGPILEVVAQNQLDATTDATPVAVGKDLYIRARTALYCLRK